METKNTYGSSSISKVEKNSHVLCQRAVVVIVSDAFSLIH